MQQAAVITAVDEGSLTEQKTSNNAVLYPAPVYVCLLIA
jgi:hypothetical protein